MPNTARVLRFPVRGERVPTLTAEETGAAAQGYLETPAAERSAELVGQALSNPDVLFSVLRGLREQCDQSPARVADEAMRIYCWLPKPQRVGLFDERDYFQGEAAFIAGNAHRLLGQREEALRWLDRAEAGFRHTVNPAPSLSNVAYARLSVRFETGHYDDVVDLAPSLIESFVKLGMEPEIAKCELVFAMALKNCARSAEALERLQQLLGNSSLVGYPTLRARLLSECGDILRLEGQLNSAMRVYQERYRCWRIAVFQ